MNIWNHVRQLKYKCVRSLESHPEISNLVYNNIRHLKFLFPHEKDYHAIKFFVPGLAKGEFIDIGANIGLSAIGFRELGYQNPIKLFEANPTIVSYLEELKGKYENLEIFQLALGNDNSEQDLYLAYYKNRCLHTFSSFSRDFIEESLRKSYPKKYSAIEIRTAKVKMRRFDGLAETWAPRFVKIDVEGHEYSILQGMKDTLHRHCPVLLIEFNPAQFKSIYDFLSPGYTAHHYIHVKNKVEHINVGELLDKIENGENVPIRNVFFSPR